MPTVTAYPTAPPATADTLKSWVMVVLTLIFVSLYGAALFGWLKPLTDDKMVMRLEPIIFAIIGYYFGRLPGQQIREAQSPQSQRTHSQKITATHPSARIVNRQHSGTSTFRAQTYQHAPMHARESWTHGGRH